MPVAGTARHARPPQAGRPGAGRPGAGRPGAGRPARPRAGRGGQRAVTWLTSLVALAAAAGVTVLAHTAAGPRAVPLPYITRAEGRMAADWLTRQPAPEALPGLAAGQQGLAAAGSSALSTAARRACPPPASACVDLADRLTWLQSGGSIVFGPVRMEPGPAGTPHATPRGVFHVEWKAGADFQSNLYGEPMPYAVFFGPGGIAFHGGSLVRPSHGCVHLVIGDAQYYNDHLQVGAEVIVF